MFRAYVIYVRTHGVVAKVPRFPRMDFHWKMWHYLSNATCLIRPHVFYALFRRVKDDHGLLHCSPLSKKTYVRQVIV